jgi:hypothetical protein
MFVTRLEFQDTQLEQSSKHQNARHSYQSRWQRDNKLRTVLNCTDSRTYRQKKYRSVEASDRLLTYCFHYGCSTSTIITHVGKLWAVH